MADNKVFSERDLPFQKVRSKSQAPSCDCDSFAKRATKTLAGAALTGDLSGVVVGAVTGKVIDAVWRKK